MNKHESELMRRELNIPSLVYSTNKVLLEKQLNEVVAKTVMMTSIYPGCSDNGLLAESLVLWILLCVGVHSCLQHRWHSVIHIHGKSLIYFGIAMSIHVRCDSISFWCLILHRTMQRVNEIHAGHAHMTDALAFDGSSRWSDISLMTLWLLIGCGGSVGDCWRGERREFRILLSTGNSSLWIPWARVVCRVPAKIHSLLFLKDFYFGFWCDMCSLDFIPLIIPWYYWKKKRVKKRLNRKKQ